MQILLASAKIMNDKAKVQVPFSHEPRFQKEARQMALELSELPTSELVQHLHCNEKIAIENKLRYQDFFNDQHQLPALLAYYGQAYKCLKAEDYSADDFAYADQHLWINSFLYGILRPLDRIHPYRLEGKAKLPLHGDKNMFAFWKPLLTDILIESVKEDDGVLVHLATAEFQQLYDWKRIEKEVKVVQPLFMVDQGTKLKAVSVYAKSCRGAMTTYILRNRLSKVDDLLSFQYNGFEYQPHYGDFLHPHFILDTI